MMPWIKSSAFHKAGRAHRESVKLCTTLLIPFLVSYPY